MEDFSDLLQSLETGQDLIRAAADDFHERHKGKFITVPVSLVGFPEIFGVIKSKNPELLGEWLYPVQWSDELARRTPGCTDEFIEFVNMIRKSMVSQYIHLYSNVVNQLELTIDNNGREKYTLVDDSRRSQKVTDFLIEVLAAYERFR